MSLTSYSHISLTWLSKYFANIITTSSITLIASFYLQFKHAYLDDNL